MHTMFSKTDMGQVEHELTKPDHAVFYQPIYRLVFSIFSNHLAAKQIEKLIVAKDRVEVDSCSFRSPTIVLIIGESYNKYHSQLYGYEKATSPRLLKRQKNGRLVTFSDVVAPWNLTSFVFKNVFSMHVVGQQGEWCDYPLFPEVFRKAGYKVAFITNQFLPKAKEAVYDFSGGFFLNNTELSESQFDVRNDKVHVLDEGILSDYDAMVKQQRIDSNANNLIIFHVMGQHVNYNARYPKRQRRWHGDDYDRPDLTARDRDFLSHYDNATLYNDSIADQIISRFEDKNAIVIYFSDHGEECFDDGFKHFGRNHSAEITPRLAHQEFDVPFWVWCSHDYAVKHPDIFQQVLQSKDRRLMTDALPHMLLYLAGISSKDYNEAYNILSPHYNEQRPRVIKNGVDYDKLMKKAKQ
jgi:heptose-I-phosphate ethanolaminephosphotransferase